MINYLKVKNYKGIKTNTLDDLQRLNIICGKNNSGKTSILEALTDYKNMSIGKIISPDCEKWLNDLFEKKIERLTNPHPRYVAKWFSNYIKKLIDEKTVWFNDEMQEILNGFQSNILQDSNLRRYPANDPNFGIVDIINIFFKNSISGYKPILIPPKRILESGIKINLGQKVEPMGNGIVNRLFYLKNQLEKTEQFNTFQKVQKSFTDITN